MIQEIADNLVTMNDTISLAVQDLVLYNKPQSSSTALVDSWSVFGPILTGIIGAGFALWSKNKEFENIEKNLKLQKQIFKQAKINQRNQWRAELNKLQDLRNQYELSLKKFDFEKISKVLDLSQDKLEKVEMVKRFQQILEKLDMDDSIIAPDIEDYEEFSVQNVYRNLDNIVQEVKRIRKQFPNVFIEIQEELLSIAQNAEDINYQAADISGWKGMDEDDVIQQFYKSLLKIQSDLNGIYGKMLDDFRTEERLKKELISKEDDPTTT